MDLPGLLAASQAALDRGEYVEGAVLARQAIGWAVELGHRADQAAALCLLARHLSGTAEFEDAARACDWAGVILRELDDQAGLCQILIVRARALNKLGLGAEALDVLAVCREVAIWLNDPTLLFWVLNRIGVVHASLQDYTRAQGFQMRALALADGLDEDARFWLMNDLSANAIGLARQQREDGDFDAADRSVHFGLGYVRQALDLAMAGRDQYRQALALDTSGMLLGLASQFRSARQQLTAARDLAIARGYSELELTTLHHLASVLLLQGRAAEAVPQLWVVLDRAMALGDARLQQDLLLDYSGALESTGQFKAALAEHKNYVALERQRRLAVSAVRARILAQGVDLDTARMDAADARQESELLRDRSRQLEQEKKELEALAADLDRRANEDALTRLSNRHHLETSLPEVFERTAKSGQGLAIVVLDIDHFKRVNDTFGHGVGDTVLTQVAALLKYGHRAGDLVGRMGGEEFLLALPGVDTGQAIDHCERLRQKVEQFDWDGIRPGLEVTISLGICIRSDESTVHELIEGADVQMYRAKQTGRNRVKWFSGLETAS